MKSPHCGPICGARHSCYRGILRGSGRGQGQDVLAAAPHRDDLLLTIGPTIEAATLSVGDWMYARYDPDTLKIVGLGVLGLRASRAHTPEFARMYELAV